MQNTLFTEPGDSCPKCSDDLKRAYKWVGRVMIKNGKYGQFLGCSRYPDCRWVKNFVPIKKAKPAPLNKKLLKRMELQRKYQEIFKDNGRGYKEMSYNGGYLIRRWDGNLNAWMIAYFTEDAYERYKGSISKKTQQKYRPQIQEQNAHIKNIFNF